MLFTLGASFVLAALKEAIKNPKRKAEYEPKMLEIAALIQSIYGRS